MESLLHAFSSSYLTPNRSKLKPDDVFSRKHSFCLKLTNGYANSTSTARTRTSVIACAKKDKKEDKHVFQPKPDEATGFFPEAVLMKEKKVQEDGKVLPEFADAEEEKLYEYLNLELESSSSVMEMRHYEVVYLIHEKHVEEVPKVNEKVQDFIKEKKGKIWRFSDWGLRRLAYKIQKATHAHYILMNFEVEAKWINDFKTMLDKDERVIRHLVIKKEEAETEDCPPPPEYHAVRGGMDDYEDEDDFDGEEEGDEEEWDEEVEMDGYDDELEDGIIDVDSYDDGEEYEDIESEMERNPSGRNAKSEKVFR